MFVVCFFLHPFLLEILFIIHMGTLWMQIGFFDGDRHWLTAKPCAHMCGKPLKKSWYQFAVSQLWDIMLSLFIYKYKFCKILTKFAFPCLPFFPRITNTALHISMTGDQTKYPFTFSQTPWFLFQLTGGRSEKLEMGKKSKRASTALDIFVARDQTRFIPHLTFLMPQVSSLKVKIVEGRTIMTN